MADDKKIMERTVPGMNRNARFAAVEYAENIGGTLKRILAYIAKERMLVSSLLGVVLFGTVCKARPLTSLRARKKAGLPVR